MSIVGIKKSCSTYRGTSKYTRHVYLSYTNMIHEKLSLNHYNSHTARPSQYFSRLRQPSLNTNRSTSHRPQTPQPLIFNHLYHIQPPFIQLARNTAKKKLRHVYLASTERSNKFNLPRNEFPDPRTKGHPTSRDLISAALHPDCSRPAGSCGENSVSRMCMRISREAETQQQQQRPRQTAARGRTGLGVARRPGPHPSATVSATSLSGSIESTRFGRFSRMAELIFQTGWIVASLKYRLTVLVCFYLAITVYLHA